MYYMESMRQLHETDLYLSENQHQTDSFCVIKLIDSI